MYRTGPGGLVAERLPKVLEITGSTPVKTNFSKSFLAYTPLMGSSTTDCPSVMIK